MAIEIGIEQKREEIWYFWRRLQVMLTTWHRICAGFRSTALLVLCTRINPYGRLPFSDDEEAGIGIGLNPIYLLLLPKGIKFDSHTNLDFLDLL